MANFRSILDAAGLALAMLGGAFIGSIFSPGINHGPEETVAQVAGGAIIGAFVGGFLWKVGRSASQTLSR